MYQDEVRDLFCERDHAIELRDPSRFRRTQMHDIPGSSVEGYCALEALKSEVLHVCLDVEQADLVVATIREQYWKNGQFSHSVYLLYYLSRTEAGLRVKNIVWRTTPS